MKDIIKMPTSKFYRVACKKCKQDQVIYSKVSTTVKCLNCGAELAESTGGKCFIKGRVLEAFG